MEALPKLQHSTVADISKNFTFKSYIAQTFHKSKGHWPSSVEMDPTQWYLKSIRQRLGKNIIAYIISDQF